MASPETFKARLAINNSSGAASDPAQAVQVVDTAPGTVTWRDKVKAYYKQLIALIGVSLMIANQVTPMLSFLPDDGKKYATWVIGALTVAGAILKDNEHWVDDL